MHFVKNEVHPPSLNRFSRISVEFDEKKLVTFFNFYRLFWVNPLQSEADLLYNIIYGNLEMTAAASVAGKSVKNKERRYEHLALLTLKDIGKIYVSEGNIAVGIRGVNLSFDRGEFVAVTGASGSGKSTLLNIISGMDSYEEGELIIEGETTSHYLQPDWEGYREKYISFIFQDYNIIESYTVLQNVELALMHIADRRERRRRAVELLTRVGLQSHLRQKGSRLSGGQKQRTVIARALAKDSPIILADEPTGNLDSKTSEEIIRLLKEVSRDKLLIMVTHNFDQVAELATRHIRIFDGAVESDRVLHGSAQLPFTKADLERSEAKLRAAREQLESVGLPQKAKKKAAGKRGEKKSSQLRNGITLGRSIFTSRPMLSLFLCLLMILGSFGIFVTTAIYGDTENLFPDYLMFTPIDGRLVITSQSGQPLTDEELAGLAESYGAESYLHYDMALDSGSQFVALRDFSATAHLKYTFGKDYGKDILGRYPTATHEVLLRLPIAFQPEYGKDRILKDKIVLERMEFDVVGIQYYYDTNQSGSVLFTKEGFRMANAALCLFSRGQHSFEIDLLQDGRQIETLRTNISRIAREMEGGRLYIDSRIYRKALENAEGDELQTDVQFSVTYYSMNYDHMYGGPKEYKMIKELDPAWLTDVKPESFESTSDATIEEVGNGAYSITVDGNEGVVYSEGVILSAELMMELGEELLGTSYRQASLFFADDKAAAAAAEKLNRAGYIAVLSSETYTPSPEETILNTLGAAFCLFIWLGAVLFIAFFVNLCSSRMVGAFRGDMAIMRSMGIPVKVIRLGMYVRMLLSLIPAAIVLFVGSSLIYRSPTMSKFFPFYLYPWQYALILAGMLILTLYVTKRQIKRLFGSSVKKALKGGNAE